MKKSIRKIVGDVICPICMGIDLAVVLVGAAAGFTLMMVLAAVVASLLLAVTLILCEPPKKGGIARRLGILDREGNYIPESKREVYLMDERSREYNI